MLYTAVDDQLPSEVLVLIVFLWFLTMSPVSIRLRKDFSRWLHYDRTI